jgi:flagellar hook-associated protein 1 FlgK
MGISTALSSALTGLRATQTSLAVTAGNIANANTDGYTRKVATLTTIVAAGKTVGVRAAQVQRALDLTLQGQFRSLAATATYADLAATYAGRLDTLFGTPGGATSLDTLFSNLTTALEGLSATPESIPAQMGVVGAGQALAQQLNVLTAEVQAMRSEAEEGLAHAVEEVNAALANIKDVNDRILAQSANGVPPAGLLDERDQYIAQIAQLMDIKVLNTDRSGIAIMTASGQMLFDGVPSRLFFDSHGMLSPQSEWSSDPASRNVGTVTVYANGQPIDLFANGAIRSGAIAAYRDLRDTVLPQAQAQLDAIAEQLALALSSEEVSGAAATSGGGADGFELNIAALLAGDTVTLDYLEMPAGTARRISFVRVDDASVLPLANTATADPSDTVFGINFSGGIGSIVTQIQTALGGSFAVSNAGDLLRILDDGAGNTIDITGLTGRRTVTGLAEGTTALPFFIDTAGTPYAGGFDNGARRVGFAGRIAVNAALAANPSALIKYGPGVQSGDPARPLAILERLREAAYFTADSGIGSTSTPYRGGAGDFIRQVLAFRGAAAESTAGRRDTQAVAISALNDRMSQTSGVNIDEEMAHLVEIQNAYAANARVMSAVREMLDMLMRM